MTKGAKDTNTNIIIGRNPVTEALKAGRAMDKILVASEDGSMKVIIAKARERGIPVMKTERATLDRMAGGKPHQGVAAYVSSYSYSTVDDILRAAADRGGNEPCVIPPIPRCALCSPRRKRWRYSIAISPRS